jgi:hypothetical protein
MHFTSPSFWEHYAVLSQAQRKVADQHFKLLKEDPRHKSLVFKKVGSYWSVRAGGGRRALAVEAKDGLVWFWIGEHDEYDRLIK